MEAIIRLDGIEKRFDGETIIFPLNLSIYEGEFITLLGASGCGKTTLLRMIAGFEEPTNGEVYLLDKPLSSKPPYERDMNMVFQQYALFPHMNVEDNILFGLRIKKIPLQEQETRLQEVLAYTKLTEYRKRRPDQLSGGQQQRVAIARAIINKPKVLLLDEPLGALDYQLRKSLQLELKSLQQRLGITFVYVTHDQEEALMMSDRVVILNKGRIEQIGTPKEIYHAPRTVFSANFIGENNIFERGEVRFCVRPENVNVSTMSNQYKKQGRILETVFTGHRNKIFITPKEEEAAVIIVYDDSKKPDQWNRGDEVYLDWASEDEVVLH